jgi:DNA-binding transcriptional LysR family regulator
METGAGLLSVELRTLIAVAEAGSFSRAAHRLGVEQSTVSRRIRDLEDGLGVSLFERYPHGVRLTSAGGAFLDRVVRSQEALAQAVAEARQAATAEIGRLRLGFVWSFAAGTAKDILAAYRSRHPAVRLQFTELGAAELLMRVLDRRVDCAWVVRWRALDPAIEVEPLWSEALHLAVPAASRLDGPQDWSVIGDASYLCRASDEWRSFQGALDQVGGPRMQIRSHDCSRESLLSLVADGDGRTLLPESIAQAGYPGVRFLPMKDPRGRLDICAIWRRETDNPALRRFLAVTRSWVKKHRPPPPSWSD